MTPLQITLLILLVTIIAFATGKIPFSVISSGIILALIITKVLKHSVDSLTPMSSCLSPCLLLVPDSQKRA